MHEQINRNIIVKGELGDIYDLWANFENFPKFMKPVQSVEKTGDGISHWVVEGPFEQKLEWDAETTTLEQNKRIAWKSIRGDIKTTGQVTFTELPNQETQVALTLQYAPSENLSRVIDIYPFGDLEEQLLENLRSFKKYAEHQKQRPSAGIQSGSR